MKIYSCKLLAVLFFICLNCILVAQDFAPIGAKWYYSNLESPLISPREGYILIESERDTIIDSKLCNILSNKVYFADGEVYHEKDIYIYEDNNKVYYFERGNFFLLYDFSANPGDTIIFRNPYYILEGGDSTFNMIVDSIGTMSQDDQDLRIIYFKYDNEWNLFLKHIEKIGNQDYFFPQRGIDCDLGCIGPLRCYSDDSLAYENSFISQSCTEIITNIFLVDEKRFLVTPNPCRNYVKINLDLTEAKVDVEIYDLHGQKVLGTQYIVSDEIFLENLNAGVYIIKIRSKTFNNQTLLIKQ